MLKEASIRQPLILGHKTYHDITKDSYITPAYSLKFDGVVAKSDSIVGFCWTEVVTGLCVVIIINHMTRSAGVYDCIMKTLS